MNEQSLSLIFRIFKHWVDVYTDVIFDQRQHHTLTLNITRNIFKNIYDEVSEDIYDMSIVRFFIEIEKKQNMGDVYSLLCLRSAELSKAYSAIHTRCKKSKTVVEFS